MSMNNKYWSLFLLASLLVGGSVYAQDPSFTQFYANPLYLNPAFAGSSNCPRVNINYRNEFPVQNVFQTYAASYDQYVEGLNGGIGLQLMQDEAGDGTFTTTDVNLIYSYHLKVSRKFRIMAGMQAGFKQLNLDWNSLTFPDQIDPFRGFVRETAELQPGNTNVGLFDLSAGIVGYTERFYFGFAAHHLTSPNVAFIGNDPLPMKFTVHTGFTVPIGKRRLHGEFENLLIPNIVYQRQGDFEQTMINVSFSRASITGGLGYRFSSVNPHAAVILLGYAPVEGRWGFGYSYDYTISELSNNMGGAHEISLRYQFPCRVARKKTGAISCPKF